MGNESPSCMWEWKWKGTKVKGGGYLAIVWQKHRERFSEVQFKEIERKYIKYVRVKMKNETVFFAQDTHEKNKLVKFSWMFFESNNYRELMCSKRRSLLLALWWDYIYSLKFICCISNLLWTQVWHKHKSCNLYYHRGICQSCPMFFPSTPEDFPCKLGVPMWLCFCGTCWNSCFHNIGIVW